MKPLRKSINMGLEFNLDNHMWIISLCFEHSLCEGFKTSFLLSISVVKDSTLVDILIIPLCSRQKVLSEVVNSLENKFCSGNRYHLGSSKRFEVVRAARSIILGSR